jgi:hypothetical protein
MKRGGCVLLVAHMPPSPYTKRRLLSHVIDAIHQSQATHLVTTRFSYGCGLNVFCLSRILDDGDWTLSKEVGQVFLPTKVGLSFDIGHGDENKLSPSRAA